MNETARQPTVKQALNGRYYVSDLRLYREKSGHGKTFLPFIFGVNYKTIKRYLSKPDKTMVSFPPTINQLIAFGPAEYDVKDFPEHAHRMFEILLMTSKLPYEFYSRYGISKEVFDKYNR